MLYSLIFRKQFHRRVHRGRGWVYARIHDYSVKGQIFKKKIWIPFLTLYLGCIHLTCIDLILSLCHIYVVLLG